MACLIIVSRPSFLNSDLIESGNLQVISLKKFGGGGVACLIIVSPQVLPFEILS